MDELLLETDDDEPRELEWSLEVGIPELDDVDPMPSTEYAAIPAASTTTTAAIQVGRIGCLLWSLPLERLATVFYRVCQHCTWSDVLLGGPKRECFRRRAIDAIAQTNSTYFEQ